MNALNPIAAIDPTNRIVNFWSHPFSSGLLEISNDNQK
jgi:hypothetical protein